DYYQAVSDPFSQALLRRYDERFPGSAKFTAGSASTGLYRGLKLWEAAVREAGTIEQAAVIRALDHARIAQGPGGAAEMVPGLHQRARVNERMDWFNTQLSRDYCFGLVFAQLLPQHKRRSDEAQAGTVQWGQERSKVWLQVLNDHILGPGRNYVCGNAITIADYFGAGLL